MFYLRCIFLLVAVWQCLVVTADELPEYDCNESTYPEAHRTETDCQRADASNKTLTGCYCAQSKQYTSCVGLCSHAKPILQGSLAYLRCNSVCHNHLMMYCQIRETTISYIVTETSATSPAQTSPTAQTSPPPTAQASPTTSFPDYLIYVIVFLIVAVALIIAAVIWCLKRKTRPQPVSPSGAGGTPGYIEMNDIPTRIQTNPSTANGNAGRDVTIHSQPQPFSSPNSAGGGGVLRIEERREDPVPLVEVNSDTPGSHVNGDAVSGPSAPPVSANTDESTLGAPATNPSSAGNATFEAVKESMVAQPPHAVPYPPADTPSVFNRQCSLDNPPPSSPGSGDGDHCGSLLVALPESSTPSGEEERTDDVTDTTRLLDEGNTTFEAVKESMVAQPPHAVPYPPADTPSVFNRQCSLDNPPPSSPGSGDGDHRGNPLVALPESSTPGEEERADDVTDTTRLLDEGDAGTTDST